MAHGLRAEVFAAGVEIPAGDRDERQDDAADDQHRAEDEAVQDHRGADRSEEWPRAGARHVHARWRLDVGGLQASGLRARPPRTRDGAAAADWPGMSAMAAFAPAGSACARAPASARCPSTPLAHRVPQPATDRDQDHDHAEREQLQVEWRRGVARRVLGRQRE